MISDVTFVIFHFLWLIHIGYPVNTYDRPIFTKVHGSLTSIPTEQHFAQSLTVIQAVQLSSLFITFHLYHANTLEVLVFRGLRHATLPVEFPLSDKSGDDRLQVFSYFDIFTYYLLKVRLLQPLMGALPSSLKLEFQLRKLHPYHQ